jgi:hypothetical protein
VVVKAPGQPAGADTKPKPPPFQIVSSRASEKWLKILIYGVYGVGKTFLSVTADEVEEMRDVLFINAESGELSIPDGIDKVDVYNYATVARVFEFLRLHVRYRDEKNEKGLKELQDRLFDRTKLKDPDRIRHFRTVIIDSLTEVQTYLMYQLLNVNPDKWMLDVTPESPEFKEWGQSSEMIQLLVRLFRDLKMNVIFVTSEQEVSDNNKLLKRPNLPGKLAGKVQGFLDVVGYLDAATNADGDIVRRLWMQPGREKFQAKHRFRNHPTLRFIDDPTMQDLHNLTKEITNAPNQAPSSSNSTDTNSDTPTTGGGSGSGVRAGAGSSGGRTVSRGPIRRTGSTVRGK